MRYGPAVATHSRLAHDRNDRSAFPQRPRRSVIEIGAREFMCVGAKPPLDHPHVFLDMGGDNEIICPYCSTLYRLDPDARPARGASAECALPEPGDGLNAGRRAVSARTIMIAGAGHRRADGGAGARRRGLPRHSVRPGRAARRDRRRHPALAQRHAHADRARPAATLAGRGHRARRRCGCAPAAPAETSRACRSAQRRGGYGAPYWVIHRADLQSALLAAVDEPSRHHAELGAEVDDFVRARQRRRGRKRSRPRRNDGGPRRSR